MAGRTHGVHAEPTTLGWKICGWIAEAERFAEVKHHIGLAHGSLEGVSPDFDGRYYPMTAAELDALGMDIWLLGHTHLPYPRSASPGDLFFLAGTPEPDGFDCRHGGSAWIITVDDSKQISPAQARTGTYRFVEDEVILKGVSDIGKLKEKYLEPEYTKTLLKIRLSVLRVVWVK